MLIFANGEDKEHCTAHINLENRAAWLRL